MNPDLTSGDIQNLRAIVERTLGYDPLSREVADAGSGGATRSDTPAHRAQAGPVHMNR